MKLLAVLEKSLSFWILLLTSLLFFLLRLPSLFEPYWYGDEGIYEVMGMGIRHGKLLYQDIWDNKPPLLYVFYSFFNGDQFSIRLLSIIFGIIAVVIFFFVARRLLNTKESSNTVAVTICTLFFTVLFGLPLIEGNIANAENFMMTTTLLGFLYILSYSKKLNPQQLFIAGLFFSVSFLFKIVAIFDIASASVFLFILHYKNRWQIVQQLRSMIPLAQGFVLPILSVFLYFLFNHALPDFLSAAFSQNVGYVGYGNSFLIPHGLLFTKVTFLIITVLFLFLVRKKLSRPYIFLYTWLVFSIFNAFFSQRPYTHYVLVALPSVSLFFGMLFVQQKVFMQERKNLHLSTVNVLIFLVILLLFSHFFHIYKKNIEYYVNFITFIRGEKTLEDYQTFFDRNTPKDYAVAQFLKQHLKQNEGVFLWGDSAQVYKLSNTFPPGRYTVAYHISASPQSLTETREGIIMKKPRFIILMSKRPYPFSLNDYNLKYQLQTRSIYERQY